MKIATVLNSLSAHKTSSKKELSVMLSLQGSCSLEDLHKLKEVFHKRGLIKVETTTYEEDGSTISIEFNEGIKL